MSLKTQAALGHGLVLTPNYPLEGVVLDGVVYGRDGEFTGTRGAAPSGGSLDEMMQAAMAGAGGNLLETVSYTPPGTGQSSVDMAIAIDRGDSIEAFNAGETDSLVWKVRVSSAVLVAVTEGGIFEIDGKRFVALGEPFEDMGVHEFDIAWGEKDTVSPRERRGEW